MTWTSLRRPRHFAVIAALLVSLVLAGIALATSPTASACPPEGCGHHHPIDPTPHPPSTPAPKYRVTLKTIHPVETQDGSVDQLQVLLNGSFVGGLSVSTLSYWNLNVTRDVTAPLYVELWDQDWPSSDDWLGAAYFDKPALGASYTKTYRLYGSGAVYDVTVKVARIS
jgi:hypothetical protein